MKTVTPEEPVRIIDARSGQSVKPGEVVRYPAMRQRDGLCIANDDDFELESARVGLFSALLVLRNLTTGVRTTVAGVVRYTHPGFLFQKVVFIPS